MSARRRLFSRGWCAGCARPAPSGRRSLPGPRWLGSSPPIKMRSGVSRSLMAVPSARNSGLESTAKLLRPEGVSSSAAERMVVITSAVRTGRVLFSTTIVWPWAQAATWRADQRRAASLQRRSLTWPASIPRVLVVVFTERTTMSATAIAGSTAVEMWRLRPRQRATTASRPGSTTGRGQTGEIGIVPCGDAGGVEIHQRHLDVRAAIGNWMGLCSQPPGDEACRVGRGQRCQCLSRPSTTSRPAGQLSPLAA